MTITNRIEMDRKVMLGKRVIRGTRIPVEPPGVELTTILKQCKLDVS